MTLYDSPKNAADASTAADWRNTTAPSITPEVASGPYPDSNPKTVFGARKPPLHHIPPIALIQLGLAMENGADKYGLFNWREHKVSASVYYDAIMRHLLSFWDGESVDGDHETDDDGNPLGSCIHHLAHVMACCAILLDALHTGQLNDDRHPLARSRMQPDVASAIRALTLDRTITPR